MIKITLKERTYFPNEEKNNCLSLIDQTDWLKKYINKRNYIINNINENSNNKNKQVSF